MKKFYIGNLEQLNGEERRTGKVSYKRLVDSVIPNRVLANTIGEKYYFEIEDNMLIGELYEEEEGSYKDIFQYYVCQLSEWDIEDIEEFGSSDILVGTIPELAIDVLLVDHWGTPWDYVMTNIEWSTDWEECRRY